MSIVNADRTPTVFFFRWLLNSRNTQTPWTQDIDAAGFTLNNVGGIVLTGPITFPDGTTQDTAGGGGAGGAVSSVFGRTGAITAKAGDYSVGQVTGAVSVGRLINTGAGLSGGGDLSADRTLALVPATASTLGGVKIGSGINVSADGTISAAAGGGAVASVFGRTGAVVAASGDYTAAQVTNAVSTAGSYADPAWITSLAWSKISGAPAATGQTPWLQNINAAGYQLLNVPVIAGNPNLIVGANGVGTFGVNTNSVTRIFVDSPGHVQITTPDDNGVRLFFNTDIGPKIGFYGSSAVNNFGIGIGSGTLQLYTHSSPYRIAFGYGSGGDSGSFTEWANFTSAGLNFTFAATVQGTAGLNIAAGAGTLSLKTSGTQRMYINSAGNVSINKPDSGYHLYINGTGAVILASNDLSISAGGGNLVLSASGGYVQVTAGTANPVYIDGGSLQFRAGSAGIAARYVIDTVGTHRFYADTGGNVTMYFNDASYLLNYGSNGTTVFYSTGPFLQYAGGSNYIQFWTNSAARLQIAGNGNLIAGNADNGYGTIYLGATQRAFVQANDTTGDVNFGGNGAINFYTGGAARATFSSAGVLTINPAAPSVNTLVVNGTSYLAYAESPFFSSNAYFNGSSWIYRVAAAAGVVNVSGGYLYLQTGASGTAGGTVSFFANMFMNPSVTVIQKALYVDPGFMGLDAQLASGNFYICLGGTPQGSAIFFRARDINGTLRSYNLPLN